jgi:spore coat polysaccharide biosynthesis protein SpsF
MAKTVVIIQARVGSTRLPGKVLKALHGKTVLAHVIERVRQARTVDDIVIATTVSHADDAIEEEVRRCGAKVFRGSEEDVLSRYYGAALENDAGIVVRITSDCPLIDPKVMDDIIGFFQQQEYDIVTNGGSDLSKRTYPRGLDTEVFSFAALEQAYKKADKQYQHEHVTPYIYEHGRVYHVMNDTDHSRHRWTLDTEEDWWLIEALYGYLYKGGHDFYMADILDVMQQHPTLIDINKAIEQKKLGTE